MKSNAADAIKGSSPLVFYPQLTFHGMLAKTQPASVPFQRAVCASACVDIWLGGYYRFGDAYLAIHALSVVAKGPTSEADNEAALARGISAWKGYLREMEVPDSYPRLALSIPSESRKIMGAAYLEEALLPRSITQQSWVLLRCGSLFQNSFDIWDGSVPMQQVSEQMLCVANSLAPLRKKAWPEVFELH